MPANKLTVQECRDLLGASALNRSDEQVEQLRDSLADLAATMYDAIAFQIQRDPESVWWTAYAADNPSDAVPDSEDDGFHDGPNLLKPDGETIQ